MRLEKTSTQAQGALAMPLEEKMAVATSDEEPDIRLASRSSSLRAMLREHPSEELEEAEAVTPLEEEEFYDAVSEDEEADIFAIGAADGSGRGQREEKGPLQKLKRGVLVDSGSSVTIADGVLSFRAACWRSPRDPDEGSHTQARGLKSS